MKYVALLRGINVGGKHTVPKERLKAVFEGLGCANVATYINSGNVLFEATGKPAALRAKIETALLKAFGFAVPTLVLSDADMRRIAAAIPKAWQNDDTQKTDVAYLFPDADRASIVDDLPVKKEFIDVRYVKGALFWNVTRADYNKSHLNKIISHKVYKSMTVRNVNTARYLAGRA